MKRGTEGSCFSSKQRFRATQRLVRETAIRVLALKRETAAEMAAPSKPQSAAGKWWTGGPAGPQQAPSAEPLKRVRIEARQRRGGRKAASAWQVAENRESAWTWLRRKGSPSRGCKGRTRHRTNKDSKEWRAGKSAAGRTRGLLQWWDAVPPSPPGIYRIGADRQRKQRATDAALAVRALAALGIASLRCPILCRG
jgi:hypothetical protein